MKLHVSACNGHYGPKHVVSLLEYNIFLNKLCCLTTLSSFSLKLSTWSCLEIRMQDEVTVLRLITVPLKEWKNSNIWEQP